MTVPAVHWQFDTIRDDAADFSRNHGRARLVRAEADAGTMSDDESLIGRLQAGEELALETVFDLYLIPLIRFANATLGAHDGARGEAGDVVSDVLTALWMRRAHLHDVQNLRAYLYRAVRNRALDHRRAESRRDARYSTLVANDIVPGMGDAPERADSQFETDQRAEVVWNTVRTMREPLRTVAILRWSHGLNFAEIGQVLATSESTARTHASRALALLRTIVPTLLR